MTHTENAKRIQNDDEWPHLGRGSLSPWPALNRVSKIHATPIYLIIPYLYIHFIIMNKINNISYFFLERGREVKGNYSVYQLSNQGLRFNLDVLSGLKKEWSIPLSISIFIHFFCYIAFSLDDRLNMHICHTKKNQARFIGDVFRAKQ